MEPYIHAAVKITCSTQEQKTHRSRDWPFQSSTENAEWRPLFNIYCTKHTHTQTHAAYRMGRNASWRLGACQQWRRPSKSISFHLSLAPLFWHINNASVGGVWRCSLSLSAGKRCGSLSGPCSPRYTAPD